MQATDEPILDEPRAVRVEGEVVVHHRATGAGYGGGDTAYGGRQRVLRQDLAESHRHGVGVRLTLPREVDVGGHTVLDRVGSLVGTRADGFDRIGQEIGRASCRERV